MSMFYKIFWTIDLIVFLFVFFKQLLDWSDEKSGKGFFHVFVFTATAMVVWNILLVPFAFGLKAIWGW